MTMPSKEKTWFDASAAEIKDPQEALRALRASRSDALIEVETLQATGVAAVAPGVGFVTVEPDLTDEQKDATAAYRRLEREILDRLAADHLEEQRAAFGLLRP
jgi:hypothetical protein